MQRNQMVLARVDVERERRMDEALTGRNTGLDRRQDLSSRDEVALERMFFFILLLDGK